MPMIKDVKSRSYLVGSISALNGKGLLGNDELEKNLVDKKCKILIVTWNMGSEKNITSKIGDLLVPDSIVHIPDIYVIGVQEFNIKQ